MARSRRARDETRENSIVPSLADAAARATQREIEVRRAVVLRKINRRGWDVDADGKGGARRRGRDGSRRWSGSGGSMSNARGFCGSTRERLSGRRRGRGNGRGARGRRWTASGV